jgi:PAS domain S-box-containing protein
VFEVSAFLNFFERLFASDFLPPGHGYFWQPALLGLHAGSDSLIAAAYFSIPLALFHLARRRPGFRWRGLLLMFGGFILACGTTHLMSIWDLWHSTYRIEGVVKAITGLLSVAAAFATVRVIPAALPVATPAEMERIDQSPREEIEARKAAAEKLQLLMKSVRQSSEAKLRSFLEAASQAILTVSGDGKIALVNGRTEEMFGYHRTELIGQPLEILLPERYRGGHVALRAGYFADPRVRPMGAEFDLAGRRKDGSEFPVVIGLGYVDTEEGRLALGMITDITRRKHDSDQLARVNAELSASEAQLRSYLEVASQGILTVSSDGLIQLVNRRTEEMFGYDRAELIGQPLEVLLPERYRGRHAALRAEYFAEPRLRAMGAGVDLTGRRKDGTEFPVEIGLSPVQTEAGRLALGLISDITERKRAADELSRVNEELRGSNAQLEQFAYVASHDLQEPLRMVSSYLELLERRYPGQLDSQAQEFIHYAVDGARRMKALIEDLLSLSRAGTTALKFHAVQARAVLEQALANLQVAVEQSHAEVTADPLPEILADAGLLALVFQNLIGNAIKFRKDRAPRVHVSAQRAAAEWTFSVRDNGIGIEPRHAARVFRIFERLHSTDVYPGSGVGLAISQRIVERHGGIIWLESQLGIGTTFFFTVPDRAPLKARHTG